MSSSNLKREHTCHSLQVILIARGPKVVCRSLFEAWAKQSTSLNASDNESEN